MIALPNLEPGARDDGNEPVQAALESIAISLKRIADALEPSTMGDAIGGLTGPLNNVAWEVGQTLGRAFEIGSRRS